MGQALIKGKRPGLLAPGGTIGCLAVGSAMEPGLVEQGIRYLERLGFKVRIELDPSAAYGSSEFLFSSDTAERRAEALKRLLADPEVGLIMACRGGYGTVEMLPLLGACAELDVTSPRAVVGFSDATALLCALYGHPSLQVVHGPSLSTTARAERDPAAKASVEALIDYLAGTQIDIGSDVNLVHLSGESQCAGPLFGGNLSILLSLLGTPWEVALDDCVLFLEEIKEAPYRVHRMLTQLKLAGRLDKLAGVLLGDFSECVHPSNQGPTLTEVVQDVFQGSKLPVFSGFPAGHGDYNYPIPLGSVLRINEASLEVEGPSGVDCAD